MPSNLIPLRPGPIPALSLRGAVIAVAARHGAGSHPAMAALYGVAVKTAGRWDRGETTPDREALRRTAAGRLALALYEVAQDADPYIEALRCAGYVVSEVANDNARRAA